MKSLSFISKIGILLFALLLMFMPSVFASDDFNLGSDVSQVHVEMDKDGFVSLNEVEAIRAKGTDATADSFNYAYRRYQGVIVGIGGILTLTFVLIFLLTFIKISSSAANPQQRAELSKSLIWVGLGAGGFGATTLLLSFGFGLFH